MKRIMHIRWWNSFTLLAVILLAIGIIGAVEGQRMVFDPGRASSGREWIIYVVAGGLMLLNGLLPGSSSTDPDPDGAKDDAEKSDAKSSSAS